MRKITVQNDFHDTEYTFHVSNENVNEFKEFGREVVEVKLSSGQMKAADKALCGMSDCKCGGLWRTGEQIGSLTWVFGVFG